MRKLLKKTALKNYEEHLRDLAKEKLSLTLVKLVKDLNTTVPKNVPPKVDVSPTAYRETNIKEVTNCNIRNAVWQAGLYTDNRFLLLVV